MGTVVPPLAELCRVAVGRRLQQARNVYPDDCAPLPTTVANELFTSMRNHGQLSCSAYRLFTRQKAHLTYVDLNRREIDECGVTALGRHRLEYINFCKVHKTDHQQYPFDMEHFCKRPDVDSTHVLKHLNIAMNTKILNLDCLAKFTNLTSLSVSTCSSFNDEHFDNVCASLHKLQHFDISETKVTTLLSLPLLTVLRSFLMYRLNLKMSLPDFCTTMSQMNELRTLDLSNRRQDVQITDYTSMQREYARCLIDFCVKAFNERKITYFPYLRLLDVSGNLFVDDLGAEAAYAAIMQFVQAHPTLLYLNVLDTALTRQVFMLTFSRKNKLCVANGGTRTQSIQALLYYAKSEREVFTSHALQTIFYLLQTTYDHFTDNELRDTVFGIEVAMRYNRKNLAIQMAGSACFYHICRLNRIKKLQPILITVILGRCLDASSRFKLIVQLQKNIWLTVCNDFLLQSITCTHSMFRTCYVALEAMVASKDSSIARMTIAIVSILAPKIPVARSRPLAKDERYIHYMINVLNENLSNARLNEQQIGQQVDDINVFTMKFTLSALWNLTDESPDACEIVVRLGGVEAVFEIIDRYSYNSNIVTKVFGLLNNIAEVKRLRSNLIKDRYVQIIVNLFNSEMEKIKQNLERFAHEDPESYNDSNESDSDSESEDEESEVPRIDIGYFAAGILSNLLLDDGPWNFEPTRRECNNLLIETVTQWPKSISTMVAYRSFSPFIPILTRYDLPGAQMWAVYAIYHVCCVDKQYEYISMLRKQGAFELFSEIAHGELTHPNVREVAQSVLATFET